MPPWKIVPCCPASVAGLSWEVPTQNPKHIYVSDTLNSVWLIGPVCAPGRQGSFLVAGERGSLALNMFHWFWRWTHSQPHAHRYLCFFPALLLHGHVHTSCIEKQFPSTGRVIPQQEAHVAYEEERTNRRDLFGILGLKGLRQYRKTSWPSLRSQNIVWPTLEGVIQNSG